MNGETTEKLGNKSGLGMENEKKNGWSKNLTEMILVLRSRVSVIIVRCNSALCANVKN